MNFSYTRISIVLSLNALAWAGVVLCKTYTDLLFLSTFPATDLPLLFLGQAIVVFGIISILSPVFAKGSRRYNSLILAIASLGVLLYALYAPSVQVSDMYPWLVFAFCLWLSALNILLAVVAMNTITDTMDARQFRQWMLWINAAANTGSLCMGMSIPFLIEHLGTEHLLSLLTVLGFACIVLLIPLKALPSLPAQAEQGHRTWQYPLFVSLALCTFCVLVVEVLADYLLKLELSRLYQDAQAAEIGSFMGPFYGIASMFTLALQLAGTRFFLNHLGIAGLLSALPTFGVMVGAALLFAPGLWAAAGLRMGEAVLRSSLNATGRELALNPLPTRIRRAAKVQMKGIGFVGTGFAAILLWGFAEDLGDAGIVWVIIITSLIWLGIAWRMNQQYRATLSDAVRTRRLYFGDDSDKPSSALPSHQQADITRLIKNALKSPEPDNVRFGLSLLSRHPKPECLVLLYPHVTSESVDIRLSSVRLLAHIPNADSAQCLKERLRNELDSEVLWTACQVLSQNTAAIDANVEQQAQALFKHTDICVRAGAVLVLNHSPNPAQHRIAAAQLQRLQKAPDANSRYAAAQAWGYVCENQHLDKNDLQSLVDDPNVRVSMAAMESIARQNWLEYVPALASRLGQGSVARCAAHLLQNFGEPVLPLLMRKLKHSQTPIAMQAVVRLLTRMPGDVVEQRLSEALDLISRQGNLQARNHFARGCALRVRDQGNSSPTLKRCVRSAIEQELDYAYKVRTVLQAPALDDAQRAECRHRLQQTEMRLLYWLVVEADAPEILNITSVLLSHYSDAQSRARRAQGFEWLEALGESSAVSKVLAYLENSHEQQESPEQALQALRQHDSELHDPWLQIILGYTPHQGFQQDLPRIYMLRQLSLFQHLPGETLNAISENCQTRRMRAGELLMREGDAPDGLYILLKGELYIESHQQALALQHAPDFCGELGLIDDSPRRADVRVSEKSDADLLFLSKTVFDDLVEEYPDVLRALIRTIIGYIRQRSDLEKA